jgi:hypothetical protein
MTKRRPSPLDGDPRYQAGFRDLPLFTERGNAAQDAVDALLAKPPVTPYADGDTSLEAAAHQASTGRATTDEKRVYEALLARPDTDDGLEVRLELKHQTASARRRGLVQKGLVEWSNRYGQTRSDRRAKIWKAVVP